MADSVQQALALLQAEREHAGELGDTPEIEVSGRFGDATMAFRRTSLSLLVNPGRYAENREPVDIPFAHLAIDTVAAGEMEGDPETFRMTVPLENAAYLVADLSTDLKLAAGQIARMVSPKRIEPARLAQMRHLALHAATEALACVYLLDLVKAQAETETTAARKPRQEREEVRPRPRPRSKPKA